MKKCILSIIALGYSALLQAVTPEIQSGFPVHIPDSDRVFASSPTIIDLNNDNLPEIVFGGSTGKVHAYHGDGSHYWTVDTGDASFESKPAVADLDNDGNLEVVVTSGSTFTPGAIGKLFILNGQTGNEICSYTPPAFSTAVRGVHSTAAIANIDTSDPELEIVFGDWSARINVMKNDCKTFFWQSRQSQDITGVPLENDFNETTHGVYINDTIWSSPAIADINSDGQLDVIIGADHHTDDTGIGVDGGRILAINGLNGHLIFAVEIDEVVWSTPAIVDVDNDGSLDIVVATGYCWQNPACSPTGITHSDGNQIYAIDSLGQHLPGWPHVLEAGYANNNNSPAIADIDNDGFVEILINAFDTNSSPTPQYEGKLFAIEHTGQLKWGAIPNIPAGQTDHTHYAATAASPIVADITGDGEFEVVIPSNWELAVFNKDGTQVSRQAPSNQEPNGFTLLGTFPLLSTPNVADIDNDGDYEIVAATGTSTLGPPRPASIYAWDLTTSTEVYQPWSSFRNSVANLGVYIIDYIFGNNFDSP